MLAKLISLDDGEEIIVDRDLTVVGRQRGNCDLLIDRHSISKLHCLVVKTDGLLYIRDLASTNGTRVNGQKVTRGALLPGDEIFFAGVGFEVYLGPDPPPQEESLHDRVSDELPPKPTGQTSESDVRLLE